MLRSLFYGLILLPLLCLSLAYADADNFTEGKDYQLVTANPNTATTTDVPKGKIQVLEFFSYGCPWCHKLEPGLEQWLKTKPADVDFVRVPVTWNAPWELLGKAYYTADALGITAKVTPAIFKAIHDDHQPMDTAQDLEQFFIAQGVKKDDFDNAFNFSPGIDAHISRGRDLMQQYGIISVPTLIVAGKYRTDTGMNGGDIDKMIKVLQFLITKAKTS